MHVLDIIILLMLLGGLFVGYRKGVISQIGTLGGLVAGFLLCRFFADSAALTIASMGTPPRELPSYTDIVWAHVGLFVGGFLVVKLLARFFRTITHALSLGFLDRLVGAVVSAFMWLLGLSLVLNLWASVKAPADWHEYSTLGNGHAIEALLELAPAVLGWTLQATQEPTISPDEALNK